VGDRVPVNGGAEARLVQPANPMWDSAASKQADWIHRSYVVK
jgi:hypothetical protein